jgi:hypothetical protein
VLIALALPIAPLYMLYERFMGGESFIKCGQDSHLMTRESLEKGFCLTLVAGILWKNHKNHPMEAKK